MFWYDSGLAKKADPCNSQAPLAADQPESGTSQTPRLKATPSRALMHRTPAVRLDFTVVVAYIADLVLVTKADPRNFKASCVATKPLRGTEGMLPLKTTPTRAKTRHTPAV